MRSFQILPHTADIRLRVEADSLKELFLAALEAMNQILKKDFSLPSAPTVQETISLSALDTTSLLIDFLSRLLTLSYANQTIFSQAEFSQLKPTSLRANLWGTKVEKFTEDIKAVTYYEANVVKNKKGNFETLIVFDI